MKTLEEIKKEFEERVFRYITGILGQYGRPLNELTELQQLTLKQDVLNLTRGIIKEGFKSTISQTKQELIDENTSDGYHTFKELYEFRKVYNAVLFNEWSRQGKYDVHKSYRHNDKELCFGGGWFIVMATLPTGQISNHYESKDWELFRCEERDFADEWDGHTAQDVVKRLLLLEKLSNK